MRKVVLLFFFRRDATVPKISEKLTTKLFMIQFIISIHSLAGRGQVPEDLGPASALGKVRMMHPILPVRGAGCPAQRAARIPNIKATFVLFNSKLQRIFSNF